VRGLVDIRPARLLALGASLLVAFSVVAGAEGSGPAKKAANLKAANASLLERSHAAVLDVYSLEARLGRARAELASLNAKTAALEREQAAARTALRFATRTLAVSQGQLAQRLRLLYVQGEPDPLAVILGSSSLDEAMAGIDDLHRAAAQSERTVDQTRRARVALRHLTAQLARRAARLHALRARAEATTASLEAAKAERERTISALRRQSQLNSGEIGALERQAKQIDARAQQVSQHAPSSGSFVPVAPGGPGGGSMTVTATGYAMGGTTATGAPVGWGIVAVDPGVIPLGSRLTIPGYGTGIAADTGAGVRGATIDLWFPTAAQALAWGRRTVTITVR
jgi:3D (Asp-Asp-Asp) domain-containing protein/peptidoglycan hydrolase CwlO-like protein